MIRKHLKKALVTGGAGFIGSQIVDGLLENGCDSVIVYDNFSTGQKRYLKHLDRDNRLKVIEGDVLDSQRLHAAIEGCGAVFHMQANADVRGGIHKTRVDLDQNVIGTWNVLEGMRIHKVPEIVFASSATVYGEPEVFPTPENIAPIQTSLYGASKYSGEAMIQAYSAYYGIRGSIFRFVSWIGERYSHGVVYDFVQKLRQNPDELEVLGDGNQRKSYLYVRDGVDGIFTGFEKGTRPVNIFNLGHESFMNVKDLASIILDELGLNNVKMRFTGGARGWIGDSPFVHLDVSKIKQLGWTPQVGIEEGIRRTVRFLKENDWIFESRM